MDTSPRKISLSEFCGRYGQSSRSLSVLHKMGGFKYVFGGTAKSDTGPNGYDGVRYFHMDKEVVFAELK